MDTADIQRALRHGTNCPASVLGHESECTCGLEWRDALQTEREMHNAWRKRAEQAEAENTVRTTFDENSARIVAKAMAKSRRLALDFDTPFPPDSAQDRIYTEALRCVAALRAVASKDKCEHTQLNKATERWLICPDCGESFPRSQHGGVNADR